MAEKPTTVWVDIDRLVPHPDNPNRMDEDAFAKLVRNIDATGHYPPIIVRSLENSQRFVDEFEQDLLQIIDGEHRWIGAKQNEDRTVEVRIWPGLSDNQAKQLLLTMNRLQGKDDPEKRSSLIRSLTEAYDPEELAELLPDDIDAIVAAASAEASGAANAAASAAAEISRQEPVTVFADPDDATLIRESIDGWLEANDPDGLIKAGREGTALAAICREWRASSES